jgi:hypothetical protein
MTLSISGPTSDAHNVSIAAYFSSRETTVKSTSRAGRTTPNSETAKHLHHEEHGGRSTRRAPASTS